MKGIKFSKVLFILMLLFVSVAGVSYGYWSDSINIFAKFRIGSNPNVSSNELMAIDAVTADGITASLPDDNTEVVDATSNGEAVSDPHESDGDEQYNSEITHDDSADTSKIDEQLDNNDVPEENDEDGNENIDETVISEDIDNEGIQKYEDTSKPTELDKIESNDISDEEIKNDEEEPNENTEDEDIVDETGSIPDVTDNEGNQEYEDPPNHTEE